jgi:hypothetical protein
MDTTEKAAKWDEILPKLGILRANLFRVDRNFSPLDEAGMIERPELVIDYTSAFLSVLEFYFPSTEEEALAASELTRLEALGQELSRAGGELREEVKREFASLKAQVETEIGRLEAENARLKAKIQNLRLGYSIAKGLAETRGELLKERDAEIARLRPYAEPRLLAAASEVLAAHDDPGNVEAIEETLVRLDQAVAWWDGLPGVGAELESEEVTE